MNQPNGTSSLNIALLIDCENAKPASIDGILGELAEKGTISIRRAYGNWKNQAGWEEKLHPFAIQPIQQFAYTKGKNAIDMCMAIDAMDLLYTEKVDCFALVTSDSDFTPLVLKLQSKGKSVIGFGESKTPEPFKKACSVFIHTDNFNEASAENPVPSKAARRSKNELRGDTELMNVLRAAVESMKGENGFAPMTRIGQYISNHSSLSWKNYGYAKWSDLIRATEYFDEESGETITLHSEVRRRKRRDGGRGGSGLRVRIAAIV
jgi:uncharacterized protein (TIGR00288 family)